MSILPVSFGRWDTLQVWQTWTFGLNNMRMATASTLPTMFMSVIKELKSDYMLKGVGEPEYYLGGNVDPLDHTWKDENVSLALSAWTYIKNVIERFEATFGAKLRLAKTLMSDLYHLESDDTPLLDNRGAAIYCEGVPTGW
jgi:hypothetical protein